MNTSHWAFATALAVAPLAGCGAEQSAAWSSAQNADTGAQSHTLQDSEFGMLSQLLSFVEGGTQAAGLAQQQGQNPYLRDLAGEVVGVLPGLAGQIIGIGQNRGYGLQPMLSEQDQSYLQTLGGLQGGAFDQTFLQGEGQRFGVLGSLLGQMQGGSPDTAQMAGQYLPYVQRFSQVTQWLQQSGGIGLLGD